jgi:hypothetical protein
MDAQSIIRSLNFGEERAGVEQLDSSATAHAQAESVSSVVY